MKDTVALTYWIGLVDRVERIHDSIMSANWACVRSSNEWRNIRHLLVSIKAMLPLCPCGTTRAALRSDINDILDRYQDCTGYRHTDTGEGRGVHVGDGQEPRSHNGTPPHVHAPGAAALSPV